MSGTYSLSKPTFDTDSSTVTKDISQVSHGLSVGNAVRLSSGDYVGAQGDSAANAEFVGFVSAVADADNFTLITEGYISGLSGLTQDSVHFLDPSSAGDVTATAPSTSGQIVKPVLIADTTTSGYVINLIGTVVP